MRRLLAIAAVLLCSSAALAGTGTITVLDSGGIVRTYAVTTNGATNFIQQMVTCDATAAAQCATVKAASTAPVAADPALVVANSPNSAPLPATQSGAWTVTANQGTAGGTPWPVSGTVTANQGGAPWTVNPGTINNWAIYTLGSGTTFTNGLAVGFVGTVDGTLHTGRVDPSFNLMVNCSVGCSGGTFNNNADAVATSATNGQVAAWLYGFNGATFDRLRTSSYGTAPTGPALATNAFVTNATNPGRAASSASSPVVPSAAPTTYHVIWPNNATGVLVHAGVTALFTCQMSNNSTTAAYLKIYNKATAPTTGTDTPVVTAIIPGPSAGGGGSNIMFGPGGLSLSAGLGVAVTTVITDADTTAPAASTLAINCQYE